MFRKVIRILGSLRLALLLLVVLAGAVAYGTFTESSFSAEVARQYVYGAPWFSAWLSMLALTLVCSALTRWPWRKHHTGFVMTHAGIVLMLIGGLIDRHWGQEAHIRLNCGLPPTDIAELGGQTLSVGVPGVKNIREHSLNMRTLTVSPDQPLTVAGPKPEIKVSVIEQGDVHLLAGALPAEAGDAAVLFSVHLPQFDFPPRWLFIDGDTNYGPLQIAFLPGMPPDSAASSAPSGHPSAVVLYLGEDGKVRYMQPGGSPSQGEIKAGSPVPLSGVPDGTFVVEKVIPHATRLAAWEPTQAPHGMTTPGLHCQVAIGAESADAWVGLTEAGQEGTPVKVGGKEVVLGLHPAFIRLPFAIQLLKFSAPFQEGLEATGSFAAFESTVSIDGEERLISMNSPVIYPETWYGPWLGTSCKLTQAGHDFPRNPDYSELQMQYDPGWLPKWLGSILICSGMAVMFYLKPRERKNA